MGRAAEFEPLCVLGYMATPELAKDMTTRVQSLRAHPKEVDGSKIEHCRELLQECRSVSLFYQAE